MPILINDSSRYAAAAASRALSLAIRTEALADEIDALHRDVRASRDEPVRRAGFRCDAAIGWMRQAGTELQRDCRPPGPHRSRPEARGLRGAMGRMPRAWQHPDQHGRQGVVPGYGVRPDVGLRPRRPAMHRARAVDSDRQARRRLGDVRWSRARRRQAPPRRAGRAARGVRVTDRLIRITTAAGRCWKCWPGFR